MSNADGHHSISKLQGTSRVGLSHCRGEISTRAKFQLLDPFFEAPAITLSPRERRVGGPVYFLLMSQAVSLWRARHNQRTYFQWCSFSFQLSAFTSIAAENCRSLIVRRC